MKLLVFTVITDTRKLSRLFAFALLANVHHAHHVFTELTEVIAEIPLFLFLGEIATYFAASGLGLRFLRFLLCFFWELNNIGLLLSL